MKFIHFYNPFLWPLTLAFLFCLYDVIDFTMIHYPYDTAAVKIAVENTIELLESASVIGTAIDNVERNSTFSPYSHILS